MRIAIMQPYFLPYIGYFQLINLVDEFVVYDNIQFTKKGWINRNRILVNGKDDFITLPLKKDSDFLNVNERFLSDDFQNEKRKLLNKIRGAYAKAPFFKSTFPLVEDIINCEERNLFDFIYFSILKLCEYLEISTKIIKSSDLNFDIEQYKGEEKVLAICKRLNAKAYINPIGGTELYNKNNFKSDEIELLFIRSKDIHYKQFDNEFIPWLSIIDLLMFNEKEIVRNQLNEYYFND